MTSNFVRGRATKLAPFDLEKPIDMVGGHNALSISELQISDCEKILRKEFGERWDEFKEKDSFKKYTKEIVPDIFYVLATIYSKYSIHLLSKILNISRYKIRQWITKPEVKEAMENGCEVYEQKMDALAATLLYHAKDLDPVSLRSMVMVCKLHNDKVKKQASIKDEEGNEDDKKLSLKDIAIREHNLIQDKKND